MGKTTGFMEYNREEVQERDPRERTGDWQEFKLPCSQETIKNQAARCMECGIPFCHSGLIFNGMVSGCPLNNLIPEWNDLIYHGLWQQALRRLLKTNNFPEFTGRVCPAPCEGSCTLGLNEKPVTIKNNEYHIIEKGFAEGWIEPQIPAFKSGYEVAIVGSGPTGLACADQLNKTGHQVTIYERDQQPGGLLRYGIPNMKLDKEHVLDRRINLMEQEGINFVTGCEAGIDISAEEIKNNYQAVVLCAGATRARELEVPGRELDGIYPALDYLKASTMSLQDKNAISLEMTARNRDVVVIGGGDTGTDCVATALRQRCSSITQLEILPKPSRKRTEDNPWPEWPRIFKLDYGQQEAKAIFAEDPRQYRVMTEGFVGDQQGRVTGVRTIRVRWEEDSQGNYKPVKTGDTAKIIPARLVILAMGFTGPERELPFNFGLDIDNYNKQKRYTADQQGLFIAGDMRTGPALVVQAINEGRKVAEKVNQYLF